jgi:hypothetical protein
MHIGMCLHFRYLDVWQSMEILDFLGKEMPKYKKKDIWNWHCISNLINSIYLVN